jgi:hypothetical protein
MRTMTKFLWEFGFEFVEGKVGRGTKGKERGAITSPSNSKTAWNGVGYKRNLGVNPNRQEKVDVRKERYAKKSRMYSNKPSVLI